MTNRLLQKKRGEVGKEDKKASGTLHFKEERGEVKGLVDTILRQYPEGCTSGGTNRWYDRFSKRALGLFFPDLTSKPPGEDQRGPRFHAKIEFGENSTQKDVTEGVKGGGKTVNYSSPQRICDSSGNDARRLCTAPGVGARAVYFFPIKR